MSCTSLVRSRRCFKSATKHFAMCNVLPDGDCVDGDDWLCPGWWTTSPPPAPLRVVAPKVGVVLQSECSADFSDCTRTRCCQSLKHQGCFKSATKDFAMCNVLPEGDCVDGRDWLCPGWWISPPSPPPPPPALACAADFADCTHSHCCLSHKRQGCFKSATKQFAMCKVLPEGACVDGKDWLCPGW